jgi:hypothetical protein
MKKKPEQVEDDFYPVVLQTRPPTIMTREEVYRKVPSMRVTHIPATNPRPEHDSGSEFVHIPSNHIRSRKMFL